MSTGQPLAASVRTNPYGGSRRLKQRFEYGKDSRSAFVELDPSYMPTAEEFKALLEAVPGVAHVEYQTTKTSQGNIGQHYFERNLLVHSQTGPGSASPPIEFELTRNQHVKDKTITPTVTAMFKDPKDGQVGEAWRILLAATKNKQLLPGHVQTYFKKHVKRWECEETVADSEYVTPASSPRQLDSDPEASAGGPPPWKRDRGPEASSASASPAPAGVGADGDPELASLAASEAPSGDGPGSASPSAAEEAPIEGGDFVGDWGGADAVNESAFDATR